MLLIEIAHPAGRFDNEDRAILGDAILDLFLAPDAHTTDTIDRARQATHIAFRELHGWRTGFGTPSADGAPPVIITLTVPAAWRDEGGDTFMGLLRTAVRRLDEARGWDRPRGGLWIRVDGVPDGQIGLDGRPSTADDVLSFLTEDFRSAQEKGTAAPAPAGRLVDPICGMIVPDGRGTITLDHDGVRLGFCADGCRAAYARREGLPL
ncbi:hypothetical protein VZC37_10885 [Gordonia sp. LSe1-13]|uniref:YHS domain-containing protein n=1 Tax=Gordonia sesuvii TaxID=3116777 RepID=A0ABU7MCL2_9ACTN|nr:hypothetical protein [Gordonia sp. LSe1-13]